MHPIRFFPFRKTPEDLNSGVLCLTISIYEINLDMVYMVLFMPQNSAHQFAGAPEFTIFSDYQFFSH